MTTRGALISFRWLWWVLVEWTIIIGCLWAAGEWIWMLPIFMLVIGSRQGALAVLAHEAVHQNGVGPRWVNDIVGNLITAWPLGLDLRSYRRWHLPHHMYLGTDRDSEIQLRARYAEQYTDLTPARRWIILLRDLLGMHWREPVEVMQIAGAHWSVGRVAYYVGVVVLVLAGWWWYVQLYLLCAMTTGWMLMRLRIWSEHVGSETPRYVAPWWQRATCSPHHIWKHWDHHQPGRWSIPGWDLTG